MIVHSTAVASAPSTHALLKMRDVVARFNLHPNTIRRATEKGELACYSLPSGHRRFAEADVLKWLGIDAEELNGNDARLPVALVARVSSRAQASVRGDSDASDLDRQISRLEDYARQRWGSAANVTNYVSVGSGLNFDRLDFVRLIDHILLGKFRGGYIVATYFDRVCRYGIRMVEQICKAGECELIFTEANPEKEVHESLADEILGILTHFTAKAHGARARKALKVIIPEDTLKLCWQWHCAGYSNGWITNQLKKEGRDTDEKGRPITKFIVRRTLLEHSETLRLIEPSTIPSHSFATFYQQFIRKGTSDKIRLAKKNMMARYRTWCENNGHSPLSERLVAKFMSSQNVEKRFDSGGCVCYCGISLMKV